MRIGNAYRIVGEIRNRGRRYKRLMYKIESEIEFQNRLARGTFCPPNINFTVLTSVKLTKAEIKAIRVYLTDRYFEYYVYIRKYKILIEHRKTIWGQRYSVKLVM